MNPHKHTHTHTYTHTHARTRIQNDAMRQIMKTGGTQVNALIQAWRKARSSGKMPEATGQGDAPTDKSIKRLAQEAGLDTKKKKLLVFDDVALTNEDGDAVTTPPIVVDL